MLGPSTRESRSVEQPSHRNLARADLWWLLVAATAGTAVYAVYLLTHPYPSYAGGLFLQFAAEIRAADFGLPTWIPYYAGDGIPFAYPPLSFYGVAALRALGVGPVAITRILPGLVYLAALGPYYLLAVDLLPERRQAGVATLLFAVTPPAFRWHISAGGVARSPALFLVLVGAVAGVRWFRTGRPRWAVLGAAAFGVSVLVHPTYVVAFGVCWVVLYLWLDRSVRGFVGAAAVAVGGVVLASPWWLQVVSRHGVDVFLAASGSHSGLGGGLDRLTFLLWTPIAKTNLLSWYYLGVVAGGVYALAQRRSLLPALALVPGFVLGKHRFLFVAGSMLTAVLVCDGLAVLVERARARTGIDRHQGVALGLALVVAAAGVGGALAAGSALEGLYQDSHTQPQPLDDGDLEAMHWARTHTDEGATFVVAGDVAEWFPYFADRTILVGWWGSEWTSTSQFYREVAVFENVASCESATCLSRALRSADRHPDYVYVPKGRYTVRAKEYRRTGVLVRSMAHSPAFEPVFESEDAAIFRVRPGEPPARTPRAAVAPPQLRVRPPSIGRAAPLT